MLTSLRKFSNSIYAKVLLGIVVIPFIFWGMGSSFVAGDKNVLVVIDKKKYSTEDFANFVKRFVPPSQKANANQIDELFSMFIGEKLIEKETEFFGINLSNNSLSKLIKNQKDFKRENRFSRLEYEKFLLKNNISAAIFEMNLSKQEKKKQLLDLIGGGLLPSKFLVNNSYDKINQKRSIQLINLNDLFKKKNNFSNDQIKSYYENNRDDFKEIYKSVKIFELNPKKLIGSDEFNEAFFKKIDEIDNIIIRGENLDYIILKFDLEKPNTFTLNQSGKNLKGEIIDAIPNNLNKKIFSLDYAEPTALIEIEDKYFIVEVIKTENIEKNLGDETVKKTILLNLEKETKRKSIAQIISKVNQNNFIKSDFDELSKNENLPIKKVVLSNQNDNKILKEELVNKIYTIPEKNIIVLHDIDLTESLLIYIDKIENTSIDGKSNEYEKYLDLSKANLAGTLFNTYDNYVKKKYKIDINYKALDTVKNYFN